MFLRGYGATQRGKASSPPIAVESPYREVIMEVRRRLMMQVMGRSLVLVVLWPVISFAESSFSVPAGSSSSSHGFSTPAGAASNGPVISSSGFSDPSGAAINAVVRGEVTEVDGDTYIVRDAQGRKIRVQPTKDTRFDYLPRPGDWIDAQLNEGRASSIRRGSPPGPGTGAMPENSPGGSPGISGGK